MRIAIVALVLAGAACAAAPRPPVAEPDGVTELQGLPSAQPAGVDAPEPPATPILVSAELAAACAISPSDDRSTPGLERDRVELHPSDRSLLRRIAACFTTGPLRKSRLLFVLGGPGSEAEPDRPLSLRRAMNASAYLEQLGVDLDRIESIPSEKAVAEDRVELRRGR